MGFGNWSLGPSKGEMGVILGHRGLKMDIQGCVESRV